MGGTATNSGWSITVDASGNVYTIGYFYGTADFDPDTGTTNLTSAGSADIFVQKLDSAGNFIWAKQMGGTATDYGRSIMIDASGNVYITGQFLGTVDFDPGAGVANLSSEGSFDIFVQKMDASGNFIWARQMGGAGDDNGRSIGIDTSGNIYTTGFFQDTADFDPSAQTAYLTTVGFSDIFVQKMSHCIETNATISPTVCNSFTSPSGNFTWISSNTYMDTIPNIGGCDSVITVNLTINTVDTSVTQTGVTLSANASGAAYKWLDCNDSHTAISGETNQVFSATANGSYAVEITENGCVDTSACYTITGIGILESDFGSSLIVYPNPSLGKFTIDLGRAYHDVSITIRSLTGQIISNKEFGNTQQLSFGIQDADGFYLIEIDTAEGRSALLKVLKE